MKETNKRKKDYCSVFYEEVEGIEIGQTCCKKHDNEVGEAGTYNPITPHINFYKCLKDKGVSLYLTILITIGGTIFSIYKYPLLCYKKYLYRKNKNYDGIIKK
jgi:hypothetical protein